MHNIIIEKPYRFVPPYESRFWGPIMRLCLGRYLRKKYGVRNVQFRNAERLTESIRAGHGILLTPNHCRPADPVAIAALAKRVGHPVFIVASWHLFMQSPLTTFVIRRMGAFSIYREGMDRQAVNASIEILVQARRPLVIFPEGVISRTNDRLTNLMEGTAFIARSAAKKRAKAAGGKVVIHPVAMKYLFQGDLTAALDTALSNIETRLTWQPHSGHVPLDRMRKVGQALLSLKEIEHLGQARQGDIDERVEALIDGLLVPLEEEWLDGGTSDGVVARVKALRTAILPDMVKGDIDEQDRQRRWRQLADLYLAQQLSFYPPHYVRSLPSVDRYLETIERFEEDMTDQVRIHQPLDLVIDVGESIEVPSRRERGADGDPLMNRLQVQLQGMLDNLSGESKMA